MLVVLFNYNCNVVYRIPYTIYVYISKLCWVAIFLRPNNSHKLNLMQNVEMGSNVLSKLTYERQSVFKLKKFIGTRSHSKGGEFKKKLIN